MSLFRKSLLTLVAVLASAVSAAWGAVSITDTQVTNVGTSTFTVVWTTSEVSKPGLNVFTDAEGTQAVANPGLEFYPIAEGDPAVVNNSAARAARRSLETLAVNRRVVAVRVTGLAPGTTYFVRPRSFDNTGTDNGASVVPLVSATTGQFTSLVSDARILRIRIPSFAAEGMILIVQGPAGTTPLSTIIGDSSPGDVALFSTAHILSTATGTNAAFTAPQQFVIRAIGAGAPSGTTTQTIDFTGAFNVAGLTAFEANIESPAPFITTQPASRTVATGVNATFTVAAAGNPTPGFQWQRKAAGSSTWESLTNDGTYSGVTEATLTVNNPAIAMSGDQFRVIASNGVQPDAISEPATLTVTAAAQAPSISVPPTPQAVIAGGTAHFTVTASGIPAVSYQWQRKPAGSSTWANLGNTATYGGTTTDHLTVTGAVLAMSGDEFRVIVSNGVLPDATSAAAALTVNAATLAPQFIAGPSSQSAAEGESVFFTASASGTPTPSLKWQIKLAGSSTWLDIGSTPNYSGATTGTLQVSNLTLAMSGDQFRAIASNGTPPDATSGVATLTVLAGPSIQTPPQSIAVTAGTVATFSVGASGTGQLAYLWQRQASGGSTWSDLADGAVYSNTTTAVMKVNAALVAMNGDKFRVVVSDTVGSITSGAATLTVNRAGATIALTQLRQMYDGTPRNAVATTNPAGLNVTFTYNGSATAPKEPGVYAVAAQIDDASYTGSITGQLIVTTDVLVRRAPTVAGGIDGSVHVTTPENISLTGWISGDLLVRGTPNTVTNGTPTIVGTRDGAGAAGPNNYSVTFETTAALRYLVRHVDEVTFPIVAAPPAPVGTRNVTITSPSQNAGDFATVRNITLSGNSGMLAVPPGTYGNLTANGTGGFVLGVAGATEPAVYNLQNLSINPLQASAKLTVVGPVIINVGTTVALLGQTGVPEHPEWVTINATGGAVSLSANAVLYGQLVAPSSLITLNGRSVIRGGVIADKLNVTVNAEIRKPANNTSAD